METLTQSLPTVEQTKQMRRMMGSMFLDSDCKHRTMVMWNKLTEEQAEERLALLQTVIDTNHATGTVPEA